MIFLSLLLTVFAQTSAAAETPFYWGAATASFQSEGDHADSDWLRWTKDPAHIVDKTSAIGAVDFWNRYDEDFKLTQDLGANAFRLSLAWEKIVPRRGEVNAQALDRYAQMIRQMRTRGLAPFVTCYHFVLPGWIADEGGLLSEKFSDDFAAFCSTAVRELAKRGVELDYLFTINEPNVLVYHSYQLGVWPPGVKDASQSLKAFRNLAWGHIKAYRAIKAEFPKIKIGIAQHLRAFHAKTWNPLDWVVARLSHWFFNQQFMDSITEGKVFFWMPGATTISEKVDGATTSTLDFIGINYYGRKMVKFVLRPPFADATEGDGPKSDLGWEIYPEGLGEVIQWSSRYKVPMIVSENGIADASDKQRGEFIEKHVAETMKARSKGFDVFGYLHWSLTDNYEWSEGQSARFGLIEIDYKTNQRKPRPSYEVYKKVIQQHSKR